MKQFRSLHTRLGPKLFVSYLVIILAGAVGLLGTAQVHAPAALDRHILRMQEAVGHDPALAADLMRNFNAALSEILLFSLAGSLIVAIAVSLFTTNRIIGPIRVMRNASRTIAAGDYRAQVSITSKDELGDLARAFNQMAGDLQGTEQRRMMLIGDVAHELRTPLSSIRSTMDGLLDDVLPAEAGTYLDVQREVGRLQRLVQDLEQLSQAEAGRISMDLQLVSIEDVIHRAAERLRFQYDEKEVQLSIHADPGLPQVIGDPQRLTQILINLLGNALQYTSAGGHVRIEADVETDHVAVSVQDTGIGIAHEHLGSIFERFYRIDKSRARTGGGSGLGLTIARYLVEAHGGEIWASSPGLGQGSTLTFTLPLR